MARPRAGRLLDEQEIVAAAVLEGALEVVGTRDLAAMEPLEDCGVEGGAAAEGTAPLRRWRFDAHSEEGTEMARGKLDQKAVVGQAPVLLSFDPSEVGQLLLFRLEANTIVERARKRLGGGQEDREMSVADCFAAALPRDLLCILGEWLQNSCSVRQVMGFLATHLTMCFYGVSTAELSANPYFYSIQQESLRRHDDVMRLMARFDHPKPTVSGAGRWAAPEVPQAMHAMQESFRKHTSDMCFVRGVSHLSLRKRFFQHGSSAWARYGIKRCVTRGGALEPAMQVVASVTSGILLGSWLQEAHTDDVDALKGALLALFKVDAVDKFQAEQAASLCLYLDSSFFASQLTPRAGDGALSFLKAIGATFVATCDETPAFPIVDAAAPASEDGREQPVTVAPSGTQSVFSAWNDSLGVAAFLCRQQGDVRGARVIASGSDTHRGAWVARVAAADLDLNANGGVKRAPHSSPPLAGLPAPTSVEEHASALLLSMRSDLLELTHKQDTPDWGLARLFRSTGASTHAALNWQSAIYFNDETLHGLHQKNKATAGLNPTVAVTAGNAATVVQSAPSAGGGGGGGGGGNGGGNSGGNGGDPKAQQRAFLAIMMRSWFSRPVSGAPRRRDPGASAWVLDALPAFLQQSESKVTMKRKVQHFGLLARRDLPFAAASPGPVATLLSDGQFLALAPIEVVTATDSSSEAAPHLNSTGASEKFALCQAGSDEFATMIPDASWRTRIVHHAAVMGLGHVLVVVVSARGSIERCALVRVSEAQRADWLELLRLVKDRYMAFLYGSAVGPFPRLGPDGSPAYAWAVEHHTVDIYARLWAAHAADVLAHGTPPPWTSLEPQAFATWKSRMGGCHIWEEGPVARRMAATIEGAGPMSALFLTIINQVVHNAFRIKQLDMCQGRLDKFNSYSEVQQFRAEYKFTTFVSELARDIGSDEHSPLLAHISAPGKPAEEAQQQQQQQQQPEAQLQAQAQAALGAASQPVGPAQPTALPPPSPQQPAQSSALAPRARAGGIWEGHKRKLALWSSNLPGVKKRRLDQGIAHQLTKIEAANNNFFCVLCCKACQKGVEHKSRRPGRPSYYCPACSDQSATVYLCRGACWDHWHSKEVLDLPPCMKDKK